MGFFYNAFAYIFGWVDDDTNHLVWTNHLDEIKNFYRQELNHVIRGCKNKRKDNNSLLSELQNRRKVFSLFH